MKNKCNKVSQTCGTRQVASCVNYEGEVNELSPLSNDCSLSVEEVLDDVYTQLEEINLSELGENCLTYIENEEGRIVVKNALIKFEEEICSLKQQIEILQSIAICETDISACDLNFGTLTTVCSTQPTTLAETLQLILDTIQP